MTNEHATAVIDTYLETEHLPVPHAILLEGPWGCGKTYFLEEIYQPRRQALAKEKHFYKTPFLFVSLFGATSAADVEKRMHRAASPSEVAIGKAAGTAVKGVGEALRVKEFVTTTLDWIAKKASRRHVEYILVFDDLERVEEGSLGEIMGLVNSLITTHKRRVILVGDEAKLLKIHEKAIWKEQNEKIIGRRVRIEPDVESVIQTSVSMVEDQATKTFMTERLATLVQLTKRSDVVNLRNLSWAIVNGAKFVRALLADPDIPHDHVARTMLVVVATTLWYRSGKLDEAALTRLPNLSVTLMVRSMGRRDERDAEDPVTTAAKLFSETFADLTVDSPPLDYQLIVEFEGSGVLNDNDFVMWTKSQFGFGPGRSEPSWRRLWHSYERPMAETDAAIEELRDELARGQHTERGEILHSAGLAIKLGKAGNNRLTGDQGIVPFFKGYIDGLSKQRRLPGKEFDPLQLEYDAYGGLGFSSKDTPEFVEIASYLDERQFELLQIERRERADAIVREAEGGELEALHKLNLMSDELSRNPVMVNIEVERVATLIANDVNSLNFGARLLAFRYHHAKHGEPLLSEIPWARQVYESILRKIGDWPEHHRVMATESLQGLIRHYEQRRDPDDQIIPSSAEEVDGAKTNGEDARPARPA
ncbi:P-loop NTPase fold protein [Brucella cytisi]|uniref:P-loop NTPase fold protein n=1 Tax=Brucella cytisi TaxID=407152 RepID=UPI0035D9CE61